MKQGDAQALIDEIESARFSPSKWESDFLESIKERIDEGFDLSEKQGDVLEKIYRKSQGA